VENQINSNHVEKEYKYTFSVIIPVYNVERYVEKSILSVIKQSIGFKKNIQIILVNDGSTDNSEKICLKYAEKYPQNIKYIKQENAGVSAARNHGMKYAEGKYINFLDSDDVWNNDAFEKVYHFFERHYKEIDMVACRMKFFGQVEGFKHALDYKFKDNYIVDIKEDYTKIQLSSSSAFFKNSVILNYKFDEGLKYSEDAKLIAKLLLEKEKYGIFSDAVYGYRRRGDVSSAIQNCVNQKEWYNDTVEKSYKEVFQYSREKYGEVIPYFQYQVMYDLQWRLTEPINHEIISEEEAEKYITSIKELLKQIEDYIICGQKSIYIEAKLYALGLKYNRDVMKELTYRRQKLYFKNIPIIKLYNNSALKLKNLDISNGVLYIEGQVRCILNQSDYEMYFEDNKGERYHFKYYDLPHENKEGIDRTILKPKGFKVQIPLSDIKDIRVIFCYKNEHSMNAKLKFEAYSKLHSRYRYSYYTKENYIITSKNDIIKINTKTGFKHFKSEILYMLQLVKHKKCSVFFYRLAYYITKPFVQKPIWIVSDRPDTANDNGFQMFQYLVQNEKDANVYFSIDKKAKDFQKVKKVGKILKFDSLRYKIKFLHASKIISSQANEFTINAFIKEKQCMKDLYKFDFVFLQHGIIKDDLSEWLHKQNKNIKLFVTSSKKEYESVINGNYAYDKDIVKLTGLPRYDNLYCRQETKKQIVFMPTWRNNLAGKEINFLGEREYNAQFKESEYFQFYNKLINDSRILDTMKKYGYTGKFCVHPNFKKQSKDFQKNNYIDIVDGDVNYQKEFTENRLLITDFSSVAFDFAYLKKPVIYTQFDLKTFFEGHMYEKGYFDYETDGFGPVCYDYETTVNAIIKYIENECKLEGKYEERIKGFYYKFDTKNCERVHQEILKLDRK